MNSLVEIEKVRVNIAARVRIVLAENKGALERPLTHQQWNAMQALSEGEITASELADKAGLLGPSLSRIIRDLSKMGVFRNLQDRRDKRVYHVSLTTKGKRLYARLSLKVGKAMKPTKEDKDNLDSIKRG